MSRVLVVDDQEENRVLLSRKLKKRGDDVLEAENGVEALEILKTHSVDLILLDVMMPEMDGRECLHRLKASKELRHLPVVMVSAFSEMDIVAGCIEQGADDYLPKPLNPVLLEARIKSCLEKKRLRDQEQALLKQMSQELNDAARYVRSILPEPINGLATVEWQYIPSAQLGGDAFGYHWVDPDHLAIYLLDVCGHGVSAALLSVSIMNLLRANSLPSVDFRFPDQVLGALNESFPMEDHNGQFFTMWYGTYRPSERILTYASAGHPAAVLLTPDGLQQLKTPGLTVGIVPGVKFEPTTIRVPASAHLYVFSDGIFEVNNEDHNWLTYEGFLDILQELQTGTAEVILGKVNKFRGDTPFDDDVALLHVAL